MGARVYIPGLGRFLSVDPVQGGTPNNYVYPTDSVNDFDLDGNFITKALMYYSYARAVRADCKMNGAGACIDHQLTIASFAFAGPAGAIGKSVAVKIASKAWTPGKLANSEMNMLWHYAKHGKAMGYRSPVTYTAGALWATRKKAVVTHQVNRATGAVRKVYKTTKRVIVRQGRRIVTYY